ncbi:MAG: 2,3-bisphosphoglycerate-independent phosphoglycerate mutase, partial [Halobacteriales archaeon]
MDAALIILDGWGLADHDHRDAIQAADTPAFDRYRGAGASGTLDASGRSVGLPEGGLGNSEVGHLTIGAGRIVEQAHTRINRAIDDGSFYTTHALTAAIEHANDHGGRLHLMGLLSDAGVHSDHEHLHALIGMAADRGIEAATHAFTDGRDTAPAIADEYLADLAEVMEDAGTGRAATVTGRYYAMDRDENWERTRKAYDAIVHREAEYEAASGVEAAEAAHDRGETDEFIEPTLIEGGPALEDGDAVVAFNFRADRMRQLVRMLGSVRPEWAFQTDPPDTRIVTMTEYDETFDFPVAFPPREPGETLGKALSEAGKT